MSRHDLSEECWLKIQPFLPVKNNLRGRPMVLQLRIFINAVCYVLKTGVPWRDLPAEFGPWKTAYNRFRSWSKESAWQTIFQLISNNAIDDICSLDGSIVRAHQDSCGGKGGPQGNCIGKSVGGNSTKIHAVVNEKKKPIFVGITAGQVHDVAVASEIIHNIQGKAVIADKAYDSNPLIDLIESKGMEAVIMPKENRKEKRDINKKVYSKRYLVECFFHDIKRFRRLASRYEKRGQHFFSMLCIACTLLWT